MAIKKSTIKTTGIKTGGSRGNKQVPIPDYFVGGQSQFQFLGLVTALVDPKKPIPGSYIDGKNWITGQLLDHMELRGGTKLIGTGLSGPGKVRGLGVGIMVNGTALLFRARGQKIEWCNISKTGLVVTDWTETGSNILPAAALGDDISFAAYTGISGAFMYVSSTNSSIYKIPLANPSSVVDLASTTYRGKIVISGSRMHLWARKTLSTGISDYNSHYVSFVDHATISGFTQVTGEAVGTGNGVIKTFTGTLAARTGVRTVFSMTLTDTHETFVDDQNGVLTGTLGGTGTINYATGAYSVTFFAAPANAQAITMAYYWEDSTSKGLADFSFTSPTRVTGEGNYFRQDDGGPFQATLPFNGTYYDLHTIKSWAVTFGSDDLANTNIPWRDNLGIPYSEAAYANADGVVLLDFTDAQNPRLRQFGLDNLGSINFTELSDQLKLDPYDYQYCIVYFFSNYDLLFCQAKTLGTTDSYNSLLFIRSKVSGTWDKLQVPASCVVVYNGMLIAGDFTSNNCYQLFSGYDDEGYVIDNFVTFSQWNLGVPGQKKTHRFEADIFIGPAQTLQFLASFDNAIPVEIFRMNGNDAGVDTTLGTVIGGSNSIGSDVVGGSGIPNAFHYGQEFVINTDRYEQIQITIKALGVGPVSVNYFGPKDNRYKGRRKLPQYNQP
jgi:hypothetical protein